MSEVHLALIDVDSLYFRVCCVTTKESEIRQAIRKGLANIKRKVQFMDEQVVLKIAVKGKGNFRDEVDSNYKGQRKELEPEMKAALNYSIQYLIDECEAIPADDMEADDVVSIWAQECADNGITYTVVHIDKDLDMIPGRHYNFVKDRLYLVEPDAAYYNFMMQCLTGDSADNIKGVPGLGPKKAAALLQPYIGNDEKLLKIVKGEFKRAFPRDHEERFWNDFTLLRMLTDWNDLHEIRTHIQDKADLSEPDVRSEGEENVQDSAVQGVPGGASDDDDGSGVAIREESGELHGDSGTE